MRKTTVSILILSLALAGPSGQAQSINPAAMQGNQSQKGGSDANKAAGAGLMAAGGAMMANPMTMPAGIALMAMGMMAMSQGDHDDQAANQSQMTAAATAFQSNPAKASAPVYTDPEKGMAGVLKTPEAKKAIDAIRNAGGDVTEKGVKMPDGSFKPWPSFSSAGALQAAGFDSKELMKKVAEIEKTIDLAGIKGLGMRESEAGGGGSHSAPVTSNESNSEHRSPASLGGEGPNRAALVAGKTINAGGEPIGARGDNLFEIIRRAYTRKTDGKHFILEESAVRNPATTKIQLKSR